LNPVGPRDAAVFEMREALAEAGCAICRLTLRSVARLMKSIAYEQVNDVDLREKLRTAGGFCNPHAHQWLAGSYSALGTALIYRDVLHSALRQLDTPEAPRRGRLRKLLSGATEPPRCPACQEQISSERHYLSALVVVAEAEPDSLGGADAVCRRHLMALLREGSPATEAIAQRTREVIQGVIANLDEVIRKEDYRFRHEPRTDAERAAAARAIDWAAGMDGLVET
jgi:hypothetical protein